MLGLISIVFFVVCSSAQARVWEAERRAMFAQDELNRARRAIALTEGASLHAGPGAAGRLQDIAARVPKDVLALEEGAAFAGGQLHGPEAADAAAGAPGAARTGVPMAASYAASWGHLEPTALPAPYVQEAAMRELRRLGALLGDELHPALAVLAAQRRERARQRQVQRELLRPRLQPPALRLHLRRPRLQPPAHYLHRLPAQLRPQ